MNPYFLATKLQIPSPPLRAVTRTRLVDAIERAIPRHKLVWISAPAGYGKTTLLAQWAHASHFAIVWLSVSEEDNSVDYFLRYLLTGWERIQPDVRESSLGLLLDTRLPPVEHVLPAFINAGSELQEHVVFVLDDFHLLTEPSIHQALTFLLDHLPTRLHFVLAGRSEPPLPLARYRVRQELLELRAEDLGLMVEESSEFLLERMELALDAHTIAHLHAQAEGWIAALQLVALSLQRRLTAPGAPETSLAEIDQLAVSGSHRFIADYLSEEVLASLAAPVQQFLLQTSILDRLSASLCDAVTESNGSQPLLERIERDNLFLMPLDDSRRWFRYHPLFADFLRNELHQRHPEMVIGLHRRAAHWYLAHDLPQLAFHHATAGDDIDLVIQILERYLVLQLMSGEITTAKHWLESLPASWYASRAELLFFQSSLMFFMGQIDACVRYNDEMERMALAAGKDGHRQLARVTAVRCFIACARNDVAPAEAFGNQALRDLPADELDIRNAIYGSLGDTLRRNGQWDKARAYYLKTLDSSHTPTFHVHAVDIFGALADLELRQGHLKGAAAYWRRARQVISEQEGRGTFPLPLIGWVYIRLGEILYEWNEVDAAADHLSKGLARAELGGDVRALVAGYVIGGRLKLALGDLGGAIRDLEQARPLVENAPFPDWVGHFRRFELECWLAQDRLRAAVNWADEASQGAALNGRPMHNGTQDEALSLAVARVFMVKGDLPSTERALALLKQLLQSAEAEGRVGVQIEGLALRAVAQWRGGDQKGAMVSLERALHMAEPEGYLRTFADLGIPMARLLQEARSRHVMPEYIATLLTAFRPGMIVPVAAARVLPEPLTAREQEVLRLLAAGLTSREIAETLVISPETVKKHTGSIYGKLGVNNRTEAAARARELDLFDPLP